MSRLLIMLFAMLLPLQFAWSAASAYCQHEQTTQGAPAHLGHHFHAHEGESSKSAANPLAADPDCASCHAGGAPVMTSPMVLAGTTAGAAAAIPAPTPPFSSALARAPDRPQWLGLV